MGNRAVITWGTPSNYEDSLGIYLHWNGGPDWVKSFLAYCEMRQFRSPDTDNYGYARLCQIIGNYFGGGLSLGIDLCKNLDCDNGDNGTYLCRKWRVVNRLFDNDDCNSPLLNCIVDIDVCQPMADRLGEKAIAEQYHELFEQE